MLLLPAYLIVRANRLEKNNLKAEAKNLWPNFPHESFSKDDALIGIVTKGAINKLVVKDWTGKELAEANYRLVYGQKIQIKLANSKEYEIDFKYTDHNKRNFLKEGDTVLAESHRKGISGSWKFLNRIYGADWRFKNSSYHFTGYEDIHIKGNWLNMIKHCFPLFKGEERIGIIKNLSSPIALSEVYGAVIPQNYSLELRVFLFVVESRRF